MVNNWHINTLASLSVGSRQLITAGLAANFFGSQTIRPLIFFVIIRRLAVPAGATAVHGAPSGLKLYALNNLWSINRRARCCHFQLHLSSLLARAGSHLFFQHHHVTTCSPPFSKSLLIWLCYRAVEVLATKFSRCNHTTRIRRSAVY